MSGRRYRGADSVYVTFTHAQSVGGQCLVLRKVLTYKESNGQGWSAWCNLVEMCKANLNFCGSLIVAILCGIVNSYLTVVCIV